MLCKRQSILAAAVTAMLATAASAQAQSVLTHHVRDALTNGEAQAVTHMAPDALLNLDIVLALRDQAGLDAFLDDLYDPSSKNYKQFLTPAEFVDRFGPTAHDYDAVLAYAKAHGFTVTGGSHLGMEIQVRGPVSAVEAAFHVKMQSFKLAGDSVTRFAPDREPTTDLAIKLWHVSGLNNLSMPHPMVVSKTAYAAAQGIDPAAVSPDATVGSGPSASFLGSDMRAAYYGGTALTGAGQNLGLFEYVGTDLADLSTYYKNVGQTNTVPITVLSTDGTSTSCLAADGCDDTEQTLDMTQSLGMAPGLASLVMYVGSVDTAIISAMTTHSPLPTTIGCSWGWRPDDPTTLDPYFERMAAQGQNFFVASGDSSTWKKSNYPWPAEDPHVVTVGGTDLETKSAAGPWASETGWVDGGGGISPDKLAIPSWQKIAGVVTSTNKASTTYRNGPDVSANANFTFYTCADQTSCLANEYGGTSFAAPMWAAYIALVNEQRANNGKAGLGFLNPIIYPLNVKAASYAKGFHDITKGTSGSYTAVKDYDLVTGWGSPKPGLIDELAP